MAERAGQWMVLIAGSVRSGKSTLAKQIVERFGGVRVGFGDAVREATAALGLPADRESWQQVGEEWVARDPSGLCEAALAPAAGQARVVVDGVRHRHVYDLLRMRAGRFRVVLIFVDADRRIRRKRLADDGIKGADLDRVLAHATEKDLPRLREAADIVADGTGDATQVLAALETMITD
jgi:dephospho-CoA kinase